MGFWAIAAPIIASALSGAAQGAMNSGKGGQTGYDYPMLTPSPYDAMNMQMTSQAAQNNLMRNQAGQLPAGMEILLDNIRRRQLLASKEQMFGKGGMPGGSIADATMSTASTTGVGPKAANARMRTALDDYASRQDQIYNFIDNLKMQGLTSAGQHAISDFSTIPRSNEIPYTGQVAPYNMPAGQGVDLGLDKINWVELFKQAKTGTTGQYQGVNDIPNFSIPNNYQGLTWSPTYQGASGIPDFSIPNNYRGL